MSTIAQIAANRDDSLLSFADAIVDFTNAGGSIDELRATIDSALPAPTIAPEPVATIDEPAWMSNPASKSQFRRVNNARRERNMTQFATIDVFRRHFPTMKDASAEYDRLTGKGVIKADPMAGTGAFIAESRDWMGYAEGDETSVWIERMESSFA
jgi:hypothetical protein